MKKASSQIKKPLFEKGGIAAIIPSPIGILGLTVFGDKLSHVEFLPNSTSLLPPQNKFIQTICHTLQNYFKKPSQLLECPLHLTGTPFQQKVWRALRKIPVGKTITYGQLAKQLKSSPRAIGNACRANPTPIVTPCHRVVAQSHLGGYAGKTQGSIFQIKIWLLTHEKNIQPTTNCITRNRR